MNTVANDQGPYSSMKSLLSFCFVLPLTHKRATWTHDFCNKKQQQQANITCGNLFILRKEKFKGQLYTIINANELLTNCPLVVLHHSQNKTFIIKYAPKHLKPHGKLVGSSAGPADPRPQLNQLEPNWCLSINRSLRPIMTLPLQDQNHGYNSTVSLESGNWTDNHQSTDLDNVLGR